MSGKWKNFSTGASGLKIGNMNSFGKLLIITFVATILLMSKATAQIEFEDAAASFGSPLPMAGVDSFCSAPSFGQVVLILFSLAIYALF